MEDEDGVKEVMVEYLKKILTSSNPSNQDYVLDVVETCITIDMVSFLQKLFAEVEVLESLH